MDQRPILRLLPPEMVQAVVRLADEDADLVGDFLRDYCGLQATPARPVRVPVEFLVDLGAALRLLSWEQAGLDPRQVAGLPDAHQALLDVLRAAVPPDRGGAEPALPPGELAARVLDAYIDHFAWAGRAELSADVLLRAADEDLLLDALADFLWTHRPR